MLGEIGADDVPSRLTLLNKVDRLDADARAALAAEYPEGHPDLGQGIPRDVAALREIIVAFFEAAMVEGELLVPYAKQSLVGEIFEAVRVLAEEYDDAGRRLRVLGHPAALARLESMLRR